MLAYELGEQLVTQLRNESLPHRDGTDNQVGDLILRLQMPIYKS